MYTTTALRSRASSAVKLICVRWIFRVLSAVTFELNTLVRLIPHHKMVPVSNSAWPLKWSARRHWY